MENKCVAFQKWIKALRDSTGDYPDPIDNCPCEHCGMLIDCKHPN